VELLLPEDREGAMKKIEAFELIGHEIPVKVFTSANGIYVGLLVSTNRWKQPWRATVKILGCLKPASYDFFRDKDGKPQRKGFRIGEKKEFEGHNISLATTNEQRLAVTYLQVLERQVRRERDLRKAQPKSKATWDIIINWRNAQIQKLRKERGPKKKFLKEAERILRPARPRLADTSWAEVVVKGERKRIQRKPRIKRKARIRS